MSTKNYWTSLRHRKISRRTMLRASGRAGVGAAGLALVGCGHDDDDDDAATAATDQAEDQAEQAQAEQAVDDEQTEEQAEEQAQAVEEEEQAEQAEEEEEEQAVAATGEVDTEATLRLALAADNGRSGSPAFGQPGQLPELPRRVQPPRGIRSGDRESRGEPGQLGTPG